MSIFTVIGLGLLAMVVILRFKVPIGAAILAGGAVMWALWNPSIPSLGSAVTEMLSQSRTYDLLFALYFVMCLEIELRKSGTLRGMVDSLNEIFSSTKVTLATMPAFLGLLPSMGALAFRPRSSTRRAAAWKSRARARRRSTSGSATSANS